VKISAYSKDARTLRDSLPDPLPPNMTRQFYDWSALRDLYHQATLIIVPLFENPYCAGLTAYLEAAACRKPVIITRTTGLASRLSPAAAVTVPPQHPIALREAIQQLLADSARAAQLATNAHTLVHQFHTPANFLDTLLPHLAEPDPQVLEKGEGYV
jgi:glycosyltransferase involved in cell wall biosynthesis